MIKWATRLMYLIAILGFAGAIYERGVSKGIRDTVKIYVKHGYPGINESQ